MTDTSQEGESTTGDEATSGPTVSSDTAETTETLSTTPSESGSESDDTLPFVPDESEDTPYECGMIEQDCPDGEKCVAYGQSGGSWDANKCVPILGEQSAGEPCTYDGVLVGTDDCDGDSMCWDVTEVDGEQIGTCAPYCTGTYDMPECPPGSQCYISSEATLVFCQKQCDPFIQGCGEGLGCYWANGSFTCIFTAANIPVGGACGFINDCTPGAGCFTAEVFPACEGSSCCAPFCELDLGDGPCGVLPDTACVAFFEENMAPSGFENVGVCIIPFP